MYYIDRVKQSGSRVDNIKLFLIGSCRNDEDLHRVRMLKEQARRLGIENKVEFKLNFTFDHLLSALAESAVGIHSMVDEHFGIGLFDNSYYQHK